MIENKKIEKDIENEQFCVYCDGGQECTGNFADTAETCPSCYYKAVVPFWALPTNAKQNIKHSNTKFKY